FRLRRIPAQADALLLVEKHDGQRRSSRSVDSPQLRLRADVARLVIRAKNRPASRPECEQGRAESAQFGTEGFLEARLLRAECQQTGSVRQLHSPTAARASGERIRLSSRTFRPFLSCSPDRGGARRPAVQSRAIGRDHRGGARRTECSAGGDRDRGEPAATFPPGRRSTPASCPSPPAAPPPPATDPARTPERAARGTPA